MQLYAHQEEAVQWLETNARGGLFDEQGLGKTIDVAVAASRMRLKRLLIVCPTSVVHNWARELQKWAGYVYDVIRTGKDTVATGVPAVIVPHGLILKPEILAQLDGFDAIVLDESHCFRNPTAKRTQLFFLGEKALCRRARICWLLTGTPMPNDPTELWTMLAGLAPDRLKHDGKLLSYNDWRERFCVTIPQMHRREKPKVVAAKNTVELRARLSGFGLRRLKKDVLNLPPIRFTTLPLTGDYDELARLNKGVLPYGFTRLPKPELNAAYGPYRMKDQQDDDLLLATAKDDKQFSTWRRECGLAKVDPALEVLRNDLECGMRKVVVFAHHREVIDKMHAGLVEFGALQITGSTHSGDRQNYIDLFQNDPNTRVLVLQLQAGGVGITLTAAQDVVFVEQSFVPGENAQAADRCHRIGQEGRVLVRFLSLANSVDEVLVEVLSRKTQMIREVIRS